MHLAQQTRVGISVVEVESEVLEDDSNKIEKIEELGILVAAGTVR